MQSWLVKHWSKCRKSIINHLVYQKACTSISGLEKGWFNNTNLEYLVATFSAICHHCLFLFFLLISMDFSFISKFMKCLVLYPNSHCWNINVTMAICADHFLVQLASCIYMHIHDWINNSCHIIGKVGLKVSNLSFPICTFMVVWVDSPFLEKLQLDDELVFHIPSSTVVKLASNHSILR